MSNSKTKLIIFSILALVFFLLIFTPSPIYADPVSEKQVEQEQILNEIEQYQSQLDILSNNYNDALIQLEEAETEIERLESEIEIAQEKIEFNKSQLKMQAICSYKYGNIPFGNVILNSTTFENFVTNLDYSKRIMGQTEQLIQEQEVLETQLQNDLIEQQEAKEDAETAAATAQAAMDNANSIISELQADYDRIDGEITEILAERERQHQTAIASATTTAAQQIVDNSANSIDVSSYNGNVVVERAYSKIGCPYSWGGTTSAGFDCSGFVSYCLTGQEGVRLGTTGTFIGWPQVSDPQPGDVCVVHNSSHQHTGIYVGGGMMVHASTYGVGVIEGPVSSDMIIVMYPG